MDRFQNHPKIDENRVPNHLMSSPLLPCSSRPRVAKMTPQGVPEMQKLLLSSTLPQHLPSLTLSFFNPPRPLPQPLPSSIPSFFEPSLLTPQPLLSSTPPLNPPVLNPSRPQALLSLTSPALNPSVPQPLLSSTLPFLNPAPFLNHSTPPTPLLLSTPLHSNLFHSSPFHVL